MKKNFSFRQRKTRRTLAIGLAALVALFAAFMALTGTDSEADTAAAAPDITLEYFNGESQQLADLVGQGGFQSTSQHGLTCRG